MNKKVGAIFILKVKGGFNKAVDFIKNLSCSAFEWGKDLVMGIINGIKSCISKVGDAVKEVADKIKSFLYFSVPDSYNIDLCNVEAASSGETEAGTMQRDVARKGIVNISVSSKWLSFFSTYAKKDKIAVQYFDIEALELKEIEMYIDGYKANLGKDTSYKGLWTVSFTLKEL